MFLRRTALLLLAACCTACAEPSLAPAAGTTRGDLFDAVWREFDLQYSMFALKGVDWDSARAVYRPRALAAPTDAALASVLGAMLLTLHDRHVSLSPKGAGPTISFRTATDSAPSTFDEALVERRYLSNGGTSSGGHVRFGIVTPGVGYLRIASFEGAGWAGEVDAVLRALGTVASLIVDVRSNPGGGHDLAVDIAGRFADRTRTFGMVRIRNGPRHDDLSAPIAEVVRPAGPKQFAGPVYVLTDRKVYSSAEDFVLAMRALPQVVVVGDTTAGSSGRPITRELPNGWTYRLSTWIELTPAGDPVEDAGLAPAVHVASRRDDLLRDADPVLEAARALATGGSVR